MSPLGEPGIDIRRARPDDVEKAVPLIYSSGPAAFDYVFPDAPGFLRRAFVDGRGEFGYDNHTVATIDGRVVGIGAAYSGDTASHFTLAAASQILRHYGPQAPGVMIRGLRTERVIPPPKRHMQYIGHLGVAPDLRGNGVGTALVRHFLDDGRRRRHRTAELDVAITNARAESLYRRLGFEVSEERGSSLANRRGRVVPHRRMVFPL